ncbi:unnamed protein product [Cyprideis torosa]|uniref:Uncharacterized protein n=1 Tax=Cyprideis torosa TaxID=163714 RepID=A0A7R8WK78_9CRUS|nr:unnamed protein product [Cyprideis torosa]CAG0900141.1 unnamed protein product [Cyprideis torosa]
MIWDKFPMGGGTVSTGTVGKPSPGVDINKRDYFRPMIWDINEPGAKRILPVTKTSYDITPVKHAPPRRFQPPPLPWSWTEEDELAERARVDLIRMANEKKRQERKKRQARRKRERRVYIMDRLEFDSEGEVIKKRDDSGVQSVASSSGSSPGRSASWSRSSSGEDNRLPHGQGSTDRLVKAVASELRDVTDDRGQRRRYATDEGDLTYSRETSSEKIFGPPDSQDISSRESMEPDFTVPTAEERQRVKELVEEREKDKEVVQERIVEEEMKPKMSEGVEQGDSYGRGEGGRRPSDDRRMVWDMFPMAGGSMSKKEEKIIEEEEAPLEKKEGEEATPARKEEEGPVVKEGVGEEVSKENEEKVTAEEVEEVSTEKDKEAIPLEKQEIPQEKKAEHEVPVEKEREETAEERKKGEKKEEEAVEEKEEQETEEEKKEEETVEEEKEEGTLEEKTEEGTEKERKEKTPEEMKGEETVEEKKGEETVEEKKGEETVEEKKEEEAYPEVVTESGKKLVEVAHYPAPKAIKREFVPQLVAAIESGNILSSGSKVLYEMHSVLKREEVDEAANQMQVHEETAQEVGTEIKTGAVEEAMDSSAVQKQSEVVPDGGEESVVVKEESAFDVEGEESAADVAVEEEVVEKSSEMLKTEDVSLSADATENDVSEKEMSVERDVSQRETSLDPDGSLRESSTDRDVSESVTEGSLADNEMSIQSYSVEESGTLVGGDEDSLREDTPVVPHQGGLDDVSTFVEEDPLVLAEEQFLCSSDPVPVASEFPEEATTVAEEMVTIQSPSEDFMLHEARSPPDPPCPLLDPPLSSESSLPQGAAAASVELPGQESDPALDEDTTPTSDEQAGLAKSLEAKLRIATGEAKAQTELERLVAWEAGKADYNGADSFSNIQRKMEETIAKAQAKSPPPEPSS